MSRILISAAHKSSGKTTLSIGLCAALTQRGIAVSPFKKGPDYIDPMWLSKAANHDCVNLDFYTMQDIEILSHVQKSEQTNKFVFVEGNKGLYDGLDLDGSNSNAALATLIDAPVVLVINVQGMTRGIAPLILGYQSFDESVNIAGVILNQYRGERHKQKLHNVIEHYTDVPVIGAVKYDTALQITERHLGLIPSNEKDTANEKIQTIATAINEQVDVDKLITIASSAPKLKKNDFLPVDFTVSKPLHIGIAQDKAFGFYYPDDLETFKKSGAELIPINTLKDDHLPELDGFFIGGGFPETHLEKLSANTQLLEDINAAINNGLPTYAECGGLMYLCQSISWHNKTYKMAGVIAADCAMHARPQGRGYVQLTETATTLWPSCDASNDSTKPEKIYPAHEFHYSGLENLPANTRFAYDVLRGTGVDGKHDGIIYKNLLANYSHLRDTSQNHWIHRFLTFVESKS